MISLAYRGGLNQLLKDKLPLAAVDHLMPYSIPVGNLLLYFCHFSFRKVLHSVGEIGEDIHIIDIRIIR